MFSISILNNKQSIKIVHIILSKILSKDLIVQSLPMVKQALGKLLL